MTAANRPTPLRPRFDAIPDALKALPSWVIWSYEQRKGRWSKPPISVRGGYARTNDSTTWATFDQARAAAQKADGIGLVLIEDLVGVDLDHVVDADGQIEPWAAEVLQHFSGCCVERSPGGDGLRIFCRGAARHSGKGGPGNRLEVYDKDSPRYLTVTGHKMGDGAVIEAQAALDWLHEVHFEQRDKPQAEKPEKPVDPPTGGLSDEDVIRRAREARNGAKFSRLWAGDAGEDPSSADLALLCILVFWTRDRAQLDRLFRRCGLMRPKWDEKRGKAAYGERTIDAALNRVDESHRPGGSSAGSTAGLPDLPLPQALARAEALLNPEQGVEGEGYPVEALGPLAQAAQAIADGAQVSPAMAGQSLLAAAALLVQSTANVRSADGGVKALSLFALTVALSGDGKDATDRVALHELHEHQRQAARAYKLMQAEYDDAMATRKKNEPRPDALPPAPYRIAADVTVEGLRRSFVEGIASQGVFSTEAGAILAGHALSPEHRTKTAATLCGLWDRGHLSVARGGAPRVELYDRRLSAHLLVQPAALGDVLADEALSGIGFWPRFLMAWPEPYPPRQYRPWKPQDDPAVGRYWGRCRDLLARTLPEDCHDLPVLEIEARALQGVARFFESMEREAKKGELRSVRPFALRATELACRIAGVLAAFDGRDVIDAACAEHGAMLAAHSVGNWKVALAGRADPVPGWALTLYRWLAEKPGGVPLRDIPRIGPAPVRPAARRDAALERLRAIGLVDIADGGATALGVDRGAA